jgi:hypothetical protein
MTTFGVPKTEPNPEAVSHADEKLMAGAPVKAVPARADTVEQASNVSVGPETESGDCNDALMRCYNQ